MTVKRLAMEYRERKLGLDAILVASVSKQNLSLYRIDAEGGRWLASRKIFYEFASPEIPDPVDTPALTGAPAKLNLEKKRDRLVISAKDTKAYGNGERPL